MCTYYGNNKVKKNYCKMQTECNMFTLFFNVHLFLNTQSNLTLNVICNKVKIIIKYLSKVLYMTLTNKNLKSTLDKNKSFNLTLVHFLKGTVLL